MFTALVEANGMNSRDGCNRCGERGDLGKMYFEIGQVAEFQWSLDERRRRCILFRTLLGERKKADKRFRQNPGVCSDGDAPGIWEV